MGLCEVRAITSYSDSDSVNMLLTTAAHVTNGFVFRVSVGLSGLWRRLSRVGVLVRPGETGGGFEA